MLKDLGDRAIFINGDEHSMFCTLYNKYWEPLYKKAFYRLGNSEDAQDAVQEVFLSLWRNKETIEVEETLAPYLFTALKYAVIKKVYQKAKKGISAPLSAEQLEQTDISTEELLQYKELQRILDTEVKKLPERMQAIYHLSRTEHLPIAEIAERLHISEQTVKNTLTTVLKRLRTKLSHHTCSIFLL